MGQITTVLGESMRGASWILGQDLTNEVFLGKT